MCLSCLVWSGLCVIVVVVVVVVVLCCGCVLLWLLWCRRGCRLCRCKRKYMVRLLCSGSPYCTARNILACNKADKADKADNRQGCGDEATTDKTGPPTAPLHWLLIIATVYAAEKFLLCCAVVCCDVACCPREILGLQSAQGRRKRKVAGNIAGMSTSLRHSMASCRLRCGACAVAKRRRITANLPKQLPAIHTSRYRGLEGISDNALFTEVGVVITRRYGGEG